MMMDPPSNSPSSQISDKPPGGLIPGAWPGEKLNPEELIGFCNERMAYFAVPRYLDFIPELPKTPTNRIEKYRLRQQGVTASTWDREKAGIKIRR